MTFVDTNVFLRFLLWDDAKKALQCKKLFATATVQRPLYTTELVIAEIIWTLESFYKYPKEKVVDAVLKILAAEAIIVPNKIAIMESLGLHALKNIDFIDAYNAVMMLDQHIKEIYSYDKHFDRINGITRYEP